MAGGIAGDLAGGGRSVRVSVSRLTVGRPDPVPSMEEYLVPGRRPVAAAEPGAVDLKVSVALDTGDNLENLLVAVGARALRDEPVGLVLYGHALPTPRFGAEPGLADRVRAGLGLGGVPFFGISQVAGTSVLRALDYARRYLDRTAAYDVPADDGVLVLGGDQGNTIDSSRHAPGTTFLADTAVAFLVRPEYGRYRYLGGATRRDPRFHRGQRLCHSQQRLFDQVCAEQAADVATIALARAGLSGRDVDWVMPQASDAMSWRAFARRLGVSSDRVRLDLIPAGGHTFGVDALVALANAERADQLQPGDRCLLVAIGEGAYFQAAVVEVTADGGGRR